MSVAQGLTQVGLARALKGTSLFGAPHPDQAGAHIAPVAGCWHDTTDTVSMDPAWPAPGQAFFYFVNAVNLIGVEGPDGVIAVPCP